MGIRMTESLIFKGQDLCAHVFQRGPDIARHTRVVRPCRARLGFSHINLAGEIRVRMAQGCHQKQGFVLQPSSLPDKDKVKPLTLGCWICVLARSLFSRHAVPARFDLEGSIKRRPRQWKGRMRPFARRKSKCSICLSHT